MLHFFNEETAQQKLESDISGMNDSVNLINNIILQNEYNEEINFILSQNKEHLQIMLQRENIINANLNTTIYTDSIDSVNLFLQQHSVP